MFYTSTRWVGVDFLVTRGLAQGDLREGITGRLIAFQNLRCIVQDKICFYDLEPLLSFSIKFLTIYPPKADIHPVPHTEKRLRTDIREAGGELQMGNDPIQGSCCVGGR